MANEEFLKPVEMMIQRNVPAKMVPHVRKELGIFLEQFEKMTDEELADIHNGLYHTVQKLQDVVEGEHNASEAGVMLYEGLKAQLVIAVIHGRDQFDMSMLLGDNSVRDLEW
jgi:hypothetical protein